MIWKAETKYKLLLEINNAIVKETTRDGLFRRLAQEISRIFPYDRFSINLYNPQTKSLNYFATAEGVSPAGLSQDDRPLAKGAIANEVIRSRKPLIIPDLSTHQFWESVRAMRLVGLNATMAYPLIIRDRILGVIHFSYMKCPEHLDHMADFLEDMSRQVAVAVDNMMSHSKLHNANEHLRMQKNYLRSQSDEEADFVFASPKMQLIMEQVRRVAHSDISVLITGETGTGKDHIARQIHNYSNRNDALMVKINCPALTSTLFESELFGHAKGAFTGANLNRVGRFEMADGGTVFLDEIGEMDISLQAKLLNVLQDQAFERVGESKSIKVDFRLISATNQDLKKNIADGSFRRDLYYRLNTFAFHIPPLRERREEIPLLVKHLTHTQAGKTHQPEPIYTSECIEAMRQYHWPGNVRELKNLVKRLVIMRPGETIDNRVVEGLLSKPDTDTPSDFLTLAEMEKLHIKKALDMTGGVVGGSDGAATLLGLPRQTLQYRMKKYGIGVNTA